MRARPFPHPGGVFVQRCFLGYGLSPRRRTTVGAEAADAFLLDMAASTPGRRQVLPGFTISLFYSPLGQHFDVFPLS